MAPPTKLTSFLCDATLFLAGGFSALLLFWVFSFSNTSTSSFPSTTTFSSSSPATLNYHPSDPPTSTFFDDPSFGYTLNSPLSEWDTKRQRWLDVHPYFHGDHPRVLLLSGSQATPCENPVGDHLLLRFVKNKGDYCRIHGCEFFYNTALFHGDMGECWSKIPTIRAAMVAHPEVEWLWWVDSDAAFTDMDFHLPLHRYKNHNLIVHGWPGLVFEQRSWTGLNAGVFLIRNCQWSLDFMAAWAAMGPQTSRYAEWGKTLKSCIKDKHHPESDDQAALVYLLAEDDKWRDKVYLEYEYYFQGYWIEILPRLDNMSRTYKEVEEKVAMLRRRRAEMVEDAYGELWEVELERQGVHGGFGGSKRPFITHFTGCQPCSGRHNKIYGGEECWEGIKAALDFADDQVLRNYGFKHVRDDRGIATSAVKPLP